MESRGGHGNTSVDTEGNRAEKSVGSGKDLIQEIGYPGLEREYLPIKKIGEGTFSTVFLAVDVNHDEYDNRAWGKTRKGAREDAGEEGKENAQMPGQGHLVALKQITKTTAPFRILSEMKILSELGGQNNTVPLITCIRHRDTVLAVFPYIEFTDFRELLQKRKMGDIKSYMKSLLIALEHVHAHGIIHRDVKPSNFLYSMEAKSGQLIDFGLSQREQPPSEAQACGAQKERQTLFFSSVASLTQSGRPAARGSRAPGYIVKDPRPAMNATRSGTRGFRAPEVLFRVERQATAIDIWSAGVVFLTILTRRYPFFNSKDDINGIVELASIYGHNEMRRAAKHYRKIWRSNIEKCPVERVPFREIVKKCAGDEGHCDDAYDLLDQMLALKAEDRITAEEALRHRFFDGL